MPRRFRRFGAPRPPAGAAVLEAWDAAMAAAREKLGPEGALTGATRELQAGLGNFLQTCHEHGVKVGPWRLQHVVPEWIFSEHPTYGLITIAHWVVGKDGQAWKARHRPVFWAAAIAPRPKDLEIKLAALDADPPAGHRSADPVAARRRLGPDR